MFRQKKPLYCIIYCGNVFEWDETNHKFKEDNRENDAVDKFYDELKKAFGFGSPKSEVERF